MVKFGSQHLFYHSFPRPRAFLPSAVDDLRYKGLCILRSLIEYGLLLTPEKFDSEPYRRSSCRACFSLSTRDDLVKPIERIVGGHKRSMSHADLFGPFAIGINQETGRQLGLQPVVYHYRSETADSLSETIQQSISQIRGLLGILSYLEALSGQSEKFHTSDKLRSGGYLQSNTETALRKMEKLPPDVRQKFFEIITDFPRLTSWNLIDWLDHFHDHFQTVDSRSNIGSLSYYKQNEWRIGLMQYGNRELFSLHDVESTQILDVRENLIEIDKSFFTAEVLNECALLASAEDCYFFDHVKEIICPIDAAKDVYSILGEFYPKGFRRKTNWCDRYVVFDRRV